MADVQVQTPNGEGLTALFDRSFAAVNPGNVKVQFQARYQEPFCADPAPPHFPPVRYPDALSTPGVVGDPDTSERDYYVREAMKTNRQDPMPMDVDSMGTMGIQHLVEVGTELLTKEELFRRAFQPQKPQKLPSAWEWQM